MKIKQRTLFILLTLLFSGAFILFYYKYIPHIPHFLLVLIPILFLVFILTAKNLEWGILAFVFIFPLINVLPYIFGIDLSMPHAPTALILFFAFFAGWLVHNIFFESRPIWDHPIFKPLFLISLVIFISGLVTFFRFTNFFPFGSGSIHELVVNVSGVRAGGALMSNVFTSLNYLTGILFFFILFNSIRSQKFIKKILLVLSCSIFLSLAFSLIQKFYSIKLGNTSFWINQGRINATFKDPNSFGFFLSIMLPILIGLFFVSRKFLRIWMMVLILLVLFVFSSAGSRSGFLGIAVSLAVFVFLYFKHTGLVTKKKYVYGFLITLFIIVLSGSIYFLSQQSNLAQRMEKSFSLIGEKDALNRLTSRKLDLWEASLHMLKSNPLTGVGVGAYIVELPNILQDLDIMLKHTDSAENYIFQVSSELGLIGLILFLWLGFEIIRILKRNWRLFSEKNRDNFILIATISAIAAVAINYIFHSYIGSYEVKYIFWIIVAILVFFDREDVKNTKKPSISKYYKRAAIAVPLLFGAALLWAAFNNLALSERAEKFGWTQDFGLYSYETDENGTVFRWARKSSGITEDKLGPTITIPVRAAHPDILERPVKLKIYAANDYFRKKSLIRELSLKDPRWVDVEYIFPETSSEKTNIVFETDRSWQPSEYLGVPDPRELAIALGEVRFQSVQMPPWSKIQEIMHITAKEWTGKFKSMLWSFGTSEIHFYVKQKNPILRLHVKGRKALKVGPKILVRLNGRLITKTYLDSEEWTSILLKPELEFGDHILSVEFVNDYTDKKTDQDRNLMLGDLDIIYLKIDD